MRPWARSPSGQNCRFHGVMHLCVVFAGKNQYQLDISLRPGAKLGRYSHASGGLGTITFSKRTRTDALLHAEYLASEWFRQKVAELCAT